jgi:hypothetical protein
MPDQHVRPLRWGSARELERRRSFTPVCRDGLEKRIGRSREFPRKGRTQRQIGRVDHLASRGVLTVPWCPDRYTVGDTEPEDRVALDWRAHQTPRRAAVVTSAPERDERPSIRWRFTNLRVSDGLTLTRRYAQVRRYSRPQS